MWCNSLLASLLTYITQLSALFLGTYCRCVFASNFPVDRINGTFPQLMAALEAVLKPYSEEDKKKFFADNAKRFYRL